MGDDSDAIDMGPSPAPLAPDASGGDIVRVVNQLQSAEYTSRINRHKHRSQVNRVVDDVRDDLIEAVDKLTERLDSGAASNKRIERALLGDEFGNKGMVHRLEALEAASQKPAQIENSQFKTIAKEWAIKLAIVIGFLVVLDYGHKALALGAP